MGDGDDWSGSGGGMTSDGAMGDGDEWGVLLYYKYDSVADLNDLVSFYDSSCRSLSLLGRVRISPHGVNVTVRLSLSFDSLISFIQFHENHDEINFFLWLKHGFFFVRGKVGGKLSSLKKHIEEVKSKELFQGTDFKLASCGQPLNDKVAGECGFTSLSIRVVEVLVLLFLSRM